MVVTSGSIPLASETVGKPPEADVFLVQENPVIRDALANNIHHAKASSRYVAMLFNALDLLRSAQCCHLARVTRSLDVRSQELSLSYPHGCGYLHC